MRTALFLVAAGVFMFAAQAGTTSTAPVHYTQATTMSFPQAQAQTQSSSRGTASHSASGFSHSGSTASRPGSSHSHASYASGHWPVHSYHYSERPIVISNRRTYPYYAGPFIIIPKYVDYEYYHRRSESTFPSTFVNPAPEPVPYRVPQQAATRVPAAAQPAVVVQNGPDTSEPSASIKPPMREATPLKGRPAAYTYTLKDGRTVLVVATIRTDDEHLVKTTDGTTLTLKKSEISAIRDADGDAVQY